MRIVKVNKDSIANILSDLLKRSPTNYGDFQDKVDAIIKNVRDNGDKAVFDYTAQFDKAEINADNILVTEEEIKEAYEEVDDELIKVIRKAIKNIRDFHEKQIQKSWFETREDGVMLGQKVTPMETCRCLCTRWKSSLSIFCTDEHCSSTGCRSEKYHHGNTSWKRWKSYSQIH